VTTYCGHGVGELFHTAPTIPHYQYNKAKGTMQAGHIFTIEPMINTGRYKDMLWPDNWTSTTVDGSRSSQFEHTILVTPTGCELLTARVGEPIDRMEWSAETFQR
jgi:methionyl aminopeptidase